MIGWPSFQHTIKNIDNHITLQWCENLIQQTAAVQETRSLTSDSGQLVTRFENKKTTIKEVFSIHHHYYHYYAGPLKPGWWLVFGVEVNMLWSGSKNTQFKSSKYFTFLVYLEDCAHRSGQGGSISCLLDGSSLSVKFPSHIWKLPALLGQMIQILL